MDTILAAAGLVVGVANLVLVILLVLPRLERLYPTNDSRVD